MSRLSSRHTLIRGNLITCVTRRWVAEGIKSMWEVLVNIKRRGVIIGNITTHMSLCHSWLMIADRVFLLAR